MEGGIGVSLARVPVPSFPIVRVYRIYRTAYLVVKKLLYGYLGDGAVTDKSSEEIAMLIQRVLDEGPFSMQQLAEESGISYDALYSWAKSRRSPKADSLRQLAAGLRQRGERLESLAADLERAASRSETA